MRAVSVRRHIRESVWWAGRMAARGAVGLIWFYRLVVSPVLPGTCRFWPSCSVYAEDAIRRYGVLRGALLAGKRLLRCHPWSRGGYDPVP